MYVQYGSYQHAPAEANMMNFIIRPVFSPRGFQKRNLVQSSVAGELKVESGETQYDLSTKIQNLIDGLEFNGQDFGLYHDDGTPTPHWMDTNDIYNLTGNEIIYKQFPANHNGEYSTGRNFAYTVRAQYSAEESLILEYRESIEHIGDAGAKVRWKSNRYRRPTYRVDSFSSVQQIIQTGYAVTLATYMLPPSPILDRPFLLGDLTRIKRTGPHRLPQGVEGYRIQWTYVFNTPDVYPAFPSVL